MIRRINTGGISFLAPLSGSCEWYWGTDHTSGDLYEAEELYRDGHPIRQNRLIFVHRPDGRVVEPIQARPGQYFGLPVWDGGTPVILLADFQAGEIRLMRYEDGSGEVTPIVTLPRSAVEDCYNLMPHVSPCASRGRPRSGFSSCGRSGRTSPSTRRRASASGRGTGSTSAGGLRTRTTGKKRWCGVCRRGRLLNSSAAPSLTCPTAGGCS